MWTTRAIVINTHLARFNSVTSVSLLRGVVVAAATGTRLLAHNPAGRVSNGQHAEATYLWLVFKY